MLNKFLRFPHKIIFYLLFALLIMNVPVFTQEKSCDEQAAEIRKMEAMLQNSCNKVAEIIDDLIYYGTNYQLLEKERTEVFIEAVEKYKSMLGEFVVISDGKQQPGKIIQDFIKLKEKAAEAGLLAEGAMPQGRAIVDIAKSKDAGKYFYSAEVGSPDAENKLKLRREFEEEYEKIVERWNEKRKEYNRFVKEELKKYQNDIKEKTDKLTGYAREYNKRKIKLSEMAISGEYKHCLGDIQATHKTMAVGSLEFALYKPCETEKTVDCIPGMGFNLMPPKDYVIEPAEIGGFPFELPLKWNANDYFKLQADCLEIKIKGEEEATIVTGKAFISFVLSGGLIPEDWIPISDNQAKVAAFVFNVEYKVCDALKIENYWDMCVGMKKLVTEVPVWELDKIPGKIVDEMIVKNAKNIYNAADELLKGKDFTPKEGETDLQRLERLEKQWEHVKTLKAGTESVENVTATIIQILVDAGVSGKVFGSKASFDLDKHILDLRKKNLLNSLESLDKQIKVSELGEKFVKSQNKVDEIAKKIDDYVQGKNVQPKTGNKVNTDATLKFVDSNGKEVKIDVASIKGKPDDIFAGGGGSKAALNPENNAQVVRITDLSSEKAQVMKKMDDFGREVIEKNLSDSPNIRVCKREKSLDLFEEKEEFDFNTGQETKIKKPVHIEYNERVENIAEDIIKKNGKLSKGQQLAYEAAVRDLNAKGYVWLDNHTGNFGFEKLPGEDRWRIVVLDSGGVYPVKGKTATEIAENARKVQLKLSEYIEGSKLNPEMARQKFLQDLGNLIDYEKVGLKNVHEVGFAPGKGMRVIEENVDKSLGEFKKISDDFTNKALEKDAGYSALKKELDNANSKLSQLPESEIQKLHKKYEKELDELSEKLDESSKKLDDYVNPDKPIEKGVETPAEGGVIRKVAPDGRKVEIKIGKELGSGGFNKVSIDAADDAWVIRQPNEKLEADKLFSTKLHDELGRNVVENEVKSGSIRVAKRESIIYEQTTDGKVGYYERIERMKEGTAKDQIEKQGGRMTPGQELAYEQAHRDLNNAGYFWMDNTTSNFSFEKLPGEDRWRVVIIDPAGIYPVKEIKGISKAEIAKIIQKAVFEAGDAEGGAYQKLFKLIESFEEKSGGKLKSGDLNNVIDWDKMNEFGKKCYGKEFFTEEARQDISKLQWAPGGERVKTSDKIAKLSDSEFTKKVDDYTKNALMKDETYNSLQKEVTTAKDGLVQKLNELDDEVFKATKQVEESGKPKGGGKASSLKELTTENTLEALLTQKLAEKTAEADCAYIRQLWLSGNIDEDLKERLKECEKMKK